MTSPHADPTFRLLFQFSEWLDCEGLMKSPEEVDDSRTHEQLVSDFVTKTDPGR